MFARVVKKAWIKKDSRLYVLRHSRITHLAGKLTEAELCKLFGWTLGTNVVKRYIHLAGVDIDAKLVRIQGLEVNDEGKQELKVKHCIRCKETLSPNHDHCPRCGLTSGDEALLVGGEEKEKIKELEDRLARVTALVEELLRRQGDQQQ